jgi:hypothetical protein
LNPVVDQERAGFLATRVAGAKLQLLPQWMRPEKELPVVNLPVDWVRLSTLNHRTRAEQMREIKMTGAENLFSGDPMGSAAQGAQLRILSMQEGFEDLKQDLRERGQQEAAVVTGEGVLINGNRRSAALRDLWVNEQLPSARYLRAYVLPSDATPDELIDLETELQVAKDYRENYSWVNEALLIEEIFESSNKDWNRVAHRMRLKTANVISQYEKLQQLHQLVAISDGLRHHADFVANESAFTELSAHIKGKSAQEAASVRNAYFLGTLSGVSYRDMRHLLRKDASNFVDSEFAAEPTLVALRSISSGGDGKVSDDLLDDVFGDSRSRSPVDLSPVLSFLAQRRRDEVVRMPSGAEVPVEELLDSVRSAIRSAAREASEETKDAQAVVAPIARLSAACDNIARAKTALVKARAQSGWDELTLKKKIREVKEAIAQIEAL